MRLRPPSKNRSTQDRRGTAGVEFAIIAPIIVFLFIGMVEVTRAVQVKHVLNDSVRSAARMAIQPGYTSAQVTQNAKDILTDNGLPTTNASVTIKVNDTSTSEVKNAVAEDKISIQITIPASQVGWVSSTFLSSQALHSETVVMMRQR